uniref:Ig-like domain-containing protein n=2 Tax=Oryzias melastigma TaxID=30732 RepID=A0A3B3C6U1_ORYME
HQKSDDQTLSTAKHSLKYFITGTAGTTNFPEFVGLLMMDEVQIGYYDSNIKKAEPKQNWMRQLFKLQPQLGVFLSQTCIYNHQLFEANKNFVKQRLNQTEGSHVLQTLNGCEWDDESNETKAFDQYGYDGEDLISLDLQTMTWITPKAQAVVIKYLWDADKPRLDRNKNAYMSLCPGYLKDLLHYRSIFGQKTERPSVSLLQKTPSSLVSCHATGFYPDRADLFWRKDGEEIHEGVEKGEILPNNDGTFQMSSELSVSSVKQEDWRRYDCVFQLSGVKEDIIITLNKAKIQTNWVSPSEFPVHHYAIGVVAAVVLLLVLGGVLYWWRKRW